AIKRLIMRAHPLQTIARGNARTSGLWSALRPPFSQRVPGACQSLRVGSRHDHPAVADNLRTIADVGSHAWYIAGHCLAQDVGEPLAVDRAERERIESRINQFDVRPRTQQEDASIEIERPDQL